MTNRKGGTPPAARPQLNMLQRRRVQEARALAAADGGQSLAAGYGVSNPDNLGMVYGFAFGVAQGTVRELLEIIDDLTGGER